MSVSIWRSTPTKAQEYRTRIILEHLHGILEKVRAILEQLVAILE